MSGREEQAGLRRCGCCRPVAEGEEQEGLGRCRRCLPVAEGKEQAGLQASVTVFLVLIFTLIFSLILASLEAAGSAANRATLQLLVDGAAESVMSDYYRPLYDEYHLFALNTGYDTSKADLYRLGRHLANRIELNLDGQQLKRCVVTDTQPYTGDGGAGFVRQAVSYEELALAGRTLSELLEKAGVLSSQAKVSEALTQKNAIESSLAELDRYTLRLMKLIDGVEVTVETTASDGTGYSVGGAFVKEFFVLPVNQVNTGINNDEIYAVLKGRYVNPLDKADAVTACIEEYMQVKNEASELEIQCNELCAEAESLETEIGRLQAEAAQETAGSEAEDMSDVTIILPNAEDMPDVTMQESGALQEPFGPEAEDLQDASAETEEVRTLKEELNAVKDELAEAETLLAAVMEQESTKAGEISAIVSDLKALCNENLAVLSEAESLVTGAMGLQEALKPSVAAFGQLLAAEGEEYDSETLTGLTDSLSLMQAYVGIGTDGTVSGGGEAGSVTDYAAIAETLKYDRELLRSHVMPLLACLEQRISFDAAEKRLSQAKELRQYLSSYSYANLQFDYSSVASGSLTELTQEQYSNLASGLLSEGLLELLLSGVDYSSDNKIETTLLPKLSDDSDGSDDSGESDGSVESDGSDDSGDSGNNLASGDISGQNEMNSDTMDLEDARSSSWLSDLCEVVQSAAGNAYDRVMMAQYIQSHFGMFTQSTAQGRTVLNYEQEYILCGGDSDIENLAGTALKLLTLRYPIVCAYALTSSSMNREASATAELIVGFAGVPFLTLAVKYLILMVWALEQAIVETAAIMRGRQVPAITGEASFCVSYTDMFTFSSEMVAKKTETFSGGTICPDYGDYLLILLLLQSFSAQAERTLGVIQENIRYGYDEDFLLANCILGFAAETEIESETSYINHGIHTYYNSSIRGYSYTLHATVKYN